MVSDKDIRKKITQLRKNEGKIYAPLKYFRGLSTLKNVETRYKKMLILILFIISSGSDASISSFLRMFNFLLTNFFMSSNTFLSLFQ